MMLLDVIGRLACIFGMVPGWNGACRQSVWHASTGTGKPIARRSCCERRIRSRCWTRTATSIWRPQRMRQPRSCRSYEACARESNLPNGWTHRVNIIGTLIC